MREASRCCRSKKRKLQQQLREEEQQRAKLQKMAPDERDTAKREIGMKKAMQRAQGERVAKSCI